MRPYPTVLAFLCTDAYPGYVRLKHRFPHQSVDHTIGQHVVGAVHTNTIEGFWSISEARRGRDLSQVEEIFASVRR